MATRQLLVRKIAKNLGVYQGGQDLSPEDYSAIDEELPTLLLSMSRQDIYQVTADVIPDEAIDDIADWVAGRTTKTFGLAGQELEIVRADAAAAEMRLRYLNTMKPTYSRVSGEYF